MMGSMLRRGAISDGSTLSLDFTTGVLDPLLTFTRLSTGTYIGADGLVKTATNNVARFDYDPTSIGTPRGLLIESAATNLAFRSNTLNSTGANEWTNANCLTPAIESGINDPSGGSNTWKVIAATGSAVHSWRNWMGGSIMTSGTAYTISVWARPAEYDRIIISDPGGGTSACTFVMQGSGTPTAINNPGVGTCTNPVMVPYKDGWWRCSATFTRTDGSSTNRSFGVAGYPIGATTSAFGASYNGDGTSGVYLYGWMMETGSGASSYIPTGASTGSRAADECSMTGTNFSSWFNATEGAFLAHARRMRTTDVGRIASANDNTANESIDIGASTTGQFIVTDGGSALATITPGTVTANTAFKIAGAFKLNDVQAALGGTLGTPDTGVTMPTVNQLMIGRQAGGSPVYLNGTVSLIKFWPTRLPDSQLQSLTT